MPRGETGKKRKKMKMKSLRKKTIATLLIAVFMVSMVASAMPVSAASVFHVYSEESIQEALDVAVDGDTVIVHAGTYEEDLVIEADIELMPFEEDVVTIKGIDMVDSTDFPLAAPNINILADGVKIHGFTIRGPEVTVGFYSSGIIVGAKNVEIYDNDFEVTNTADVLWNDIGQALQTWLDVDVSGLNIHDNSFTPYGAGDVGYEGIFINPDLGTGTVTITDNTFSGPILRAISTQRARTVIIGNTIPVCGYQGIWVTETTDVTVNYNNILSTLVNDDTEELDARFNWWGSKWPFDFVADIIGLVDYDPWLSDLYPDGEPMSSGSSDLEVDTSYPAVSITVDSLIEFDPLTLGGWAQRTSVEVLHTGSEQIKELVTWQIIDDTEFIETPTTGKSFYETYLKYHENEVYDTGADPLTEVTIDYSEDGIGNPDGTATVYMTLFEVPISVEPGTYDGTIVFWAEYAGAMPE